MLFHEERSAPLGALDLRLIVDKTFRFTLNASRELPCWKGILLAPGNVIQCKSRSAEMGKEV